MPKHIHLDLRGASIDILRHFHAALREQRNELNTPDYPSTKIYTHDPRNPQRKVYARIKELQSATAAIPNITA